MSLVQYVVYFMKPRPNQQIFFSFASLCIFVTMFSLVWKLTKKPGMNFRLMEITLLYQKTVIAAQN